MLSNKKKKSTESHWLTCFNAPGVWHSLWPKAVAEWQTLSASSTHESSTQSAQTSSYKDSQDEITGLTSNKLQVWLFPLYTRIAEKDGASYTSKHIIRENDESKLGAVLHRHKMCPWHFPVNGKKKVWRLHRFFKTYLASLVLRQIHFNLSVTILLQTWKIYDFKLNITFLYVLGTYRQKQRALF